MSIARNTIVKEISRKSIFDSATNVITSAVSYNQGDLLVFTAASHIIAKPAAESEASTFLGVSVETVVSGRKASPFSDSNDASLAVGLDCPGPVYGVVAKAILKNAEGLFPGDYVYLDPSNGAQNVSSSGTKPVGIYLGVAITGNGVADVECLFGARYPNDTLKF